MISKHCGQYLRVRISHGEGYKRGQHEWQCTVCKTVFKQRIRLPQTKKAVVCEGSVVDR